MGGHNAGDIASRLATTSLRNFYEATVTGPLPLDALGTERAALYATHTGAALGVFAALAEPARIASL